jgi:hypothetical protein
MKLLNTGCWRAALKDSEPSHSVSESSDELVGRFALPDDHARITYNVLDGAPEGTGRPFTCRVQHYVDYRTVAVRYVCRI